MDYLDPRKQFRQSVLLMIGYVSIAIAIIVATVVLLYIAYGFGLTRSGTVIQNGFVFFASHPHPASIYINNKLANSQTNSRVTLPAGAYKVRLTRTGYMPWQRTVEVNGGSVLHFDYPLLLPSTVKSVEVDTYNALPGLTAQSPDRRWLLVSRLDNPAAFQLYDLNDPTKVATTITLPATVVTAATTSQTWQSAEWADDNQHVLVQHVVDGKTEFILIDRQNPDQSVNLSQTLNTSPTNITLNNKKYDQYYIYNATDHSLETASLKTPQPSPILTNVLAYKSYGSNNLLYVTSTDAPAGKVWLQLLSGSKTTTLRSFPDNTQYLVDLASYNGVSYVVAGAASEGKVYIYKDPLSQIAAQPSQVIVPVQVLKVAQPDYESFSSNAQFIMAENGNQIAVYDIQNDNAYTYTLHNTLDAAEPHVMWMDGDRLTYSSGGKLEIMDYDATNGHDFTTIVPASQAFFTPQYTTVYAFSHDPDNNSVLLNRTSLLTAADQ